MHQVVLILMIGSIIECMSTIVYMDCPVNQRPACMEGNIPEQFAIHDAGDLWHNYASADQDNRMLHAAYAGCCRESPKSRCNGTWALEWRACT